MQYIALVEEPGRDTRALPGLFESADDAMDEHVSFQEHPQAKRFLIAQVVTEIALDD